MAARLPSVGRLARSFRNILNSGQGSATCVGLRKIHMSPLMLIDGVRVKMPSLSPTMYEGSIVQWNKKEGDAVGPGDILCEIQTDKAVVGFEIEEEGILAKILVPENSGTIKIGTLIALMVEEGEDWQSVEIPADTDSPKGTEPAESVATQASDSAAPVVSGHHQGVGPAVKMLLNLYNIEAASIKGSGPHGNLIKSDVLNYVTEKKLQPGVSVPSEPLPSPSPSADTLPSAPSQSTVPPSAPTLYEEEAEFVDIELTNMRKIIAKRLTESKMSLPHAYCTMDCDIGKLITLRKDLIAEGVKVSVNDFIIKAAAIALQRVPEVNASWADDQIMLLPNIDISIAVATESGLITPIVKNAVNLDVQDISATVRELAGRAKENRLKPDEFQGGTFTISNLGMFGVSEFTAIINPPQSCIMAVGASRLVLGANKRPQTRMKVTVSTDRRVVDEVLAARFLETFRDVLQNPLLMVTAATGANTVDLQRLFAK